MEAVLVSDSYLGCDYRASVPVQLTQAEVAQEEHEDSRAASSAIAADEEENGDARGVLLMKQPPHPPLVGVPGGARLDGGDVEEELQEDAEAQAEASLQLLRL